MEKLSIYVWSPQKINEQQGHWAFYTSCPKNDVVDYVAELLRYGHHRFQICNPGDLTQQKGPAHANPPNENCTSA